jgi:hypothetical protein
MSQKTKISIGEVNGDGANIAGRDVNIEKNVTNVNIEKFFENSSNSNRVDDRVINEIFDHIEQLKLASQANDLNISKEENVKKILHLTEKISLNFSKKDQKEFSSSIKEIWSIKSFVEDFIKIKLENDETKVFAIKHKIQRLYRTIKNSSCESPIEDLGVIDKMTTECIPQSKKDDSLYELYTKAIIYCFFEFCDFGNKTKTEEKNRKTLFELC